MQLRAFWQTRAHLGFCKIWVRQLTAAPVRHLCGSGSGNILLSGTAGGIGGLRHDGQLEESSRKNSFTSFVPVSAQHCSVPGRTPLHSPDTAFKGCLPPQCYNFPALTCEEHSAQGFALTRTY